MLYKVCWEDKYPWIKRHPLDESKAICIICPSSISIDKGESQIKRHAGIQEVDGVTVNHNSNSHAIAMDKIQQQFGNGGQLTRERMINIMFAHPSSETIRDVINTADSAHHQTAISCVNDTHFKGCWDDKYPWIKRHPLDETKAICIICPSAVTITRGESQIKRHAGIPEVNEVTVNCNSHAIAMDKIQQQFGNGGQLTREQLNTIMFAPPGRETVRDAINTAGPAHYQTTIFEVMHVFHAVTHSQSYNSCGKLMTLQRFLLCKKKKVFETAIKCGEMKARAIVGNVLGDFCLQMVMSDFRSGSRFFSLQTDCSNVKNKKFLPIIICYADFDEAGRLGIKYQLVDFIEITDERANTIAQHLIGFVQDNNINPSLLTGYSADNAAVNFGVHKGVFKLLSEQLNQNIFGSNCLAHLCHNAAKKFISKIEGNIESLVLAVYNYFTKSAIRRERLRVVFQARNLRFFEPIKHVSTRWTTLGPAIERLLRCWSQLKHFFNEEGIPTTRDLTSNNKLIKESMFDREVETLIRLQFAQTILLSFSKAIFQLEHRETTVIDTNPIMSKLQNSMYDYIFDLLSGDVRATTQNVTDVLYEKHKSEQIESIEAAITYISDKYESQPNVEARRLVEPLTLLDGDGLFRFPEFYQLQDIVNVFSIRSVNLDSLRDEFSRIDDVNPAQLDSEDFRKMSTVQKWSAFFLEFSFCIEIKKVLCYLFSIPASSSEAERIFSSMNMKKRKDRGKLSSSMLRKELIISSNFGPQKMKSEQFYDLICNDDDFLTAVKSGQKYNHVKKRNAGQQVVEPVPLPYFLGELDGEIDINEEIQEEVEEAEYQAADTAEVSTRQTGDEEEIEEEDYIDYRTFFGE